MISVPSFLGNHIYVLKNPLFHSTLYRVAPNQGGKVASGYNLPMAWSNPSRAANKEIELFQLFGFRPGHSSKLVQLPHGYGMVWVYVLFMSFALLHWLMVDLPLWKIWKSVGMIIPNILYGKYWKVIKAMFQTTNQCSLKSEGITHQDQRTHGFPVSSLGPPAGPSVWNLRLWRHLPGKMGCHRVLFWGSQHPRYIWGRNWEKLDT